MIDPDGINVDRVDRNNIISLREVPPFEGYECYCLDDEKDYKKFISDVERSVRKSFEYRNFINYLRDNMQMNQCAYLEGVNNTEGFDIKIEIHHYPFTLYDIAQIVTKKRIYYKESISLNMVAKEITKLHYQLLVGLIPLSETVHELVHAGRLFIDVNKVIGNYNTFVNMYQPFIDPELIEMLDRIEKYSNEQRSDLLNNVVLDKNRVTYAIEDPHYQLPDTSSINTSMINQLDKIKANNYLLPTVNDTPLIEQKRKIRKPIIFDNSLKLKNNPIDL